MTTPVPDNTRVIDAAPGRLTIYGGGRPLTEADVEQALAVYRASVAHIPAAEAGES